LFVLFVLLFAHTEAHTVHFFQNHLPNVKPPALRRNAFPCEIEHGCIPAASTVTEEAEERVPQLAAAVAIKKVNMQMTAAANHISLSLPTSGVRHITCPDFSQSPKMAHMALQFEKRVPPEMFEGNPYISAGLKFGCKDALGELAPVYAKVDQVKGWHFNHAVVELMVSRANMTDLFTGKMKFDIVPDSLRNKGFKTPEGQDVSDVPYGTHAPPEAAKGDSPSSPSMEVPSTDGGIVPLEAPDVAADEPMNRRSMRRMDFIATTLKNPSDSSKCKWSKKCIKFLDTSLSLGTKYGLVNDFLSKDTQCPTDFPNVNLLSMSSHWDKSSTYFSGTADTSDSTCSGDDCTCDDFSASTGPFRYWCCNDNDMKNTFDINAIKFNANYDETTKTKKSPIEFNDFLSCDNCYAYLNVEFNFEIDMLGTVVSDLGNYLIPSELKRFKAAVKGEVDISVALSLKSGATKTTLGPVEILKKAAKPLYTYDGVIGSVPVKFSLNFELAAQIDLEATLQMPSPMTASASVKGSANFGGEYQSANNAFTPINTFSLQYAIKKPDFSKLNGANLTADVKLTVIPIVHILVYDLVPVEAEIRPYVGVELAKYAEGDTSVKRQAPCASGTGSDLWAGPYYGVGAIFRMARPITPAAWSLGVSQISGLFEGIVLACRTKDDAHKIAFSLTGRRTSVEVIPAGTTVAKASPSECSKDDAVCTCVVDATQKYEIANGGLSKLPLSDTIYLLRYPSQGSVTILKKTAFQASCLSLNFADTGGSASGGTASGTITNEKIVQIFTYANLEAGTFNSDVLMQKVYNRAYGLALGLFSATSKSWDTGTSVTSVAAAARRAASVTYTATTSSAAEYSAANAAAASQTQATHASFLAAAKSATTGASSVVVPTATEVSSVGTVTSVTGTYSLGSSGLSTGAIVGIVIGCVLGVGIVVGVIAFIAMGQASGSGSSTTVVIKDVGEPSGVSTDPSDGSSTTVVITDVGEPSGVSTEPSIGSLPQDNEAPPGASYQKNGVWYDDDGNPINTGAQ